MTKYDVRVEYIPEPAFDGMEWGWEASATEPTSSGPGFVLPGRDYRASSKFTFDSMEEAKKNFHDLVDEWLKSLSLNREQKFYREV